VRVPADGHGATGLRLMPSADRDGAIATGLRAGDRRSLARVLSWIEACDPRGHAAIDVEGSPTAHIGSYIVGLTGAPGVGKSTLTNALIATIRRTGQSVAVLAVDPSSPLSGGALLGDRIRMLDHLHDPGVFIRSLATRGDLGGLAAAIPASLRALEAFGFDWLIVETVGVGQVQVDVSAHVDTTFVVVNPGWGDDIQASKAGILEIADVFVVNKADRPGADDTVLELTSALALAAPRPWQARVVRCVGRSGEGLDELWSALLAHREHLTANNGLQLRRRQRRLRDLTNAVHALAIRHADELLHSAQFADLAAAAAAGDITPTVAARRVLAGGAEHHPGSRPGPRPD
jgi:LAO/AO transport system kinase